MASIHLTRNNKNGKAVHGTMRVGERDIETLENADYIIPDGTYTVSVTYSPRFKKMMTIICRMRWSNYGTNVERVPVTQ